MHETPCRSISEAENVLFARAVKFLEAVFESQKFTRREHRLIAKEIAKILEK